MTDTGYGARAVCRCTTTTTCVSSHSHLLMLLLPSITDFTLSRRTAKTDGSSSFSYVGIQSFVRNQNPTLNLHFGTCDSGVRRMGPRHCAPGHDNQRGLRLSHLAVRKPAVPEQYRGIARGMSFLVSRSSVIDIDYN